MNVRSATLWTAPLCYALGAVFAFAHPDLRALWWLQALLLVLAAASWLEFLRDRRAEVLPSHAATSLAAALAVLVMLVLQVVP